jgi:Anti-sigma-K factor rskA, C-terminal
VLHCDDDDLSLIALGETADPENTAHLESCARCQQQLDELSAVVAQARAVTDADYPVAAPPQVWDAISAELGLSPAQEEGMATVTPITQAPRRSAARTWWIAGAAAAVGLVLGGIVTTSLPSTTPSGELVAQATLDPFDDSGLTGTAKIEQTSDGARLRIDAAGLPPVEDGYYEVWMATGDTTTMVAIGTLNPGEPAEFVLPAGMAVGDFPVVDVSVEHFDGDPGHSATSVLRGQLSA